MSGKNQHVETKISPLLIERNGQLVILHHSQFDTMETYVVNNVHTFRIEVVSTIKILYYNNWPLLGGSENLS